MSYNGLFLLSVNENLFKRINKLVLGVLSMHIRSTLLGSKIKDYHNWLDWHSVCSCSWRSVSAHFARNRRIWLVFKIINWVVCALCLGEQFMARIYLHIKKLYHRVNSIYRYSSWNNYELQSLICNALVQTVRQCLFLSSLFSGYNVSMLTDVTSQKDKEIKFGVRRLLKMFLRGRAFFFNK